MIAFCIYVCFTHVWRYDESDGNTRKKHAPSACVCTLCFVGCMCSAAATLWLSEVSDSPLEILPFLEDCCAASRIFCLTLVAPLSQGQKTMEEHELKIKIISHFPVFFFFFSAVLVACYRIERRRYWRRRNRALKYGSFLR